MPGWIFPDQNLLLCPYSYKKKAWVSYIMSTMSAPNCKESCSKVRGVLLTPKMLCCGWEALSKWLIPCSWGIENMGTASYTWKKMLVYSSKDKRENTKLRNTDRQGNKGKMRNLRKYHPLLGCTSDSWMKKVLLTNSPSVCSSLEETR